MKRMMLFAAAAFALAACASQANLSEGKRTNFRCAGDKEFSYRQVPGAIEVYASGQTNRLEGADGQYRSGDGVITLSETGGRATLTGVTNGPFENCSRRSGDWRFDLW